MARLKLTQAANRVRAVKVYNKLLALYPHVDCTLNRKNPLELLIATILAAQCTDARVNVVTKTLFKKCRKPEDYVAAPIEELEGAIHTCGFYRMKARSIVGACRQLIEQHGGKVPGTIEELTALPGVGRKTANVVLGDCFGVQGVVVDTHCMRLSKRLGFTRNGDPLSIEKDLMKVWPPDRWSLFSHLMVFHGRAVCTSRAPKCSQCAVNGRCPFPATREGRKIAR